MKTRITKISPPILLILYTIFLSAFTGCTHEKKEDTGEEIDLTVELVPSGEQVISGNQEMLVLYDIRRTIEVKDIMYDTGEGFKPVDTSGSPPVINPGEYKFIFCAECLDAPKVKLKVEFTKESETEPLETEYTIDRLPVINLIAEETEPGIVILNAGESIDPEGKELQFTWLSDTMSVEGPLFGGNIDSINSKVTYLIVSDGVSVINKLIKIDRGPEGIQVPGARNVFLTCTSMNVFIKGISLLNPALMLGPVPNIGDTLPIDKTTKKLTRDFYVGHKFEVGGTVVRGPNQLIVGQDVSTTSVKGVDTTVTQGFKRNADGKTFDKKKKIAPLCPVPAPKKFTPAPSLIADDYSTLVFNSIFYQNTNTGVKQIAIVGKNVAKQTRMGLISAWFDAPGSVFRKGFDFSKGYKRNSLFRAFMKEDITKCEKYFYYELEIDSNGVVKKNTITVLN